MKVGKSAHRIKRLLLQIAVAMAVLATGVSSFSCKRLKQKPAAPPEKVTIAYASHPQAALAQVAQSRGFYRDEGLEVTAHPYPSGQRALEAMLEGKADMATAAETPVMLAIMKGKKLSVIATIQTSSMAHAIVARKDRGVITPGDIKGKRIGVALGSSSHFALDAILVSHGISRKDVEVVNLKAEDAPDALARGDVDAASTFTPYVEYAQKKLGDRAITFRNKDIYKYNFFIVATQEYIRENPGTVKKILRALVRAENFARGNLAEAQKIVTDTCGIEIGIVHDSWGDAALAVTLDQALIFALEDESRWAIGNGLASEKKVPNYLDYIYFDGLKSIKPDAVRILR